MATLAIVKDLEVLDERCAGREVGEVGGVGGERLTRQEFTLQGGEEAFGHRVVVAVADGAHRTLNAPGSAVFPKEQ